VRLLGLGDAPIPVPALVDGYLTTNALPSLPSLQGFFRVLLPKEREEAARQLVQRGVDPALVAQARGALLTPEEKSNLGNYFALASAAACGFHGYRRNKSVVWGALWFGFGMTFPIFADVVAFAQGFGKEKR
jgi:hypothetical protein